MAAINFTITNDGNPQAARNKWYATPDDGSRAFAVGYTAIFSDGDGAHRGLAQTRIINEIPRLFYDRELAAQSFGLWAHFVWPTVIAESGGHHLLVNTYDRARFTFGFYQLAAHTPADNLILLFRRLLTLPSAQRYFPDLTLVGGLVHRTVGEDRVSLETVTSVLRPNGRTEDQIVGFMSYLNPDTVNVGEIEVRNTARLMHWLLNDPQAVRASAEVAIAIMKGKVRRQATAYGLAGGPVELAIWVSDIIHQGRGGRDQIRAALAAPSHAAKLEALYQIGSSEPDYDSRRETVRARIKTLLDEGRFAGVTLGSAALPLT